MDLNDILVFARVVQAGSFTAAARGLSMPKSTVSRKVFELEERLGSRLLQRTTRKLSLTDVGRTYYEHAARIVAEVEEAERAVSLLEQEPRGLLRVTAPLNFGFLGPITASFLARYPEVQLELVCTDRVVDLVEERFDVGIRAGALGDSTLIAKNLGNAPRFLIASRSYLQKRGRPRTPDDLGKHDCMLFGAGVDRAVYRLTDGEDSVELAVQARLIVNDSDMLHAAAVAGLGIALLPIFRCAEDLRHHRLERVLRDWNAVPTPIQAVYPSTRHLSPKVRAFVEHLHAQMTPPPWERAPAP
jgi:DNA-binding transcriptional LysR family regulator